MTDIERIELAIRRVLASANTWNGVELLTKLADELAKMRQPLPNDAGYTLRWVP